MHVLKHLIVYVLVLPIVNATGDMRKFISGFQKVIQIQTQRR